MKTACNTSMNRRRRVWNWITRRRQRFQRKRNQWIMNRSIVDAAGSGPYPPENGEPCWEEWEGWYMIHEAASEARGVSEDLTQLEDSALTAFDDCMGMIV